MSKRISETRISETENGSDFRFVLEVIVLAGLALAVVAVQVSGVLA